MKLVKARFFQMLDDVVTEYRNIESIPKNTKLELAAEYIKYCVDADDSLGAAQFLEPYYGTAGSDVFECLGNVIFPHEKESRLLALAQLERILKDNAVRIIDHMINSELRTRYTEAVGEE